MKVLLLAGTGEGRRIAAELHRMGVPAVASLAGETREAMPLALPTRVGGFGSAQGFADYLRKEKITHVLDATHPFAVNISARSAQVAAQQGVKYLQFLRDPWVAGPNDLWTEIDTEEAVAGLLSTPSTVFLATGRKTLAKFKNLEGHRVLVRQIDPPTSPIPFEGGEFIIGRPPFSVKQEVALFEALGVDLLVVKNAGGQASYSKLEAASVLGLPVAMIRRPAQPDVARVAHIEAALDWVRAR
ncbi:cobalt-precorrin-6A reductase [Nereida sp. MMG025]|uniref:cobalt-precorrin-6A reductase n=1 Tax=Nereida sp. MMG025 TaxID=2909981 RepID=UPI001F02E8C0|nr:cobalt-precorrin-6A reductase [Nereida sp. MMG025]MCF6443504.1 cobalt-precorrin-6A reductase [Nereida sp. MMG025]